jgi:CelD/BcsL family acetyltransferase involved in cellulose biosynthesis
MVGLMRSLGREAGSALPIRRERVEPQQKLVLETIRDRRAIYRLEPEWRALMVKAARRATIYQSFDWAAACADQMKPGTQLCILAARERGRLVAIAPLAVESCIGLSTLRWLGGSLAIYGDVLADTSVDVPEWLGRALADLAARGEAQSLLLDNVRADARVAPFLASMGRETVEKQAPWIDMSGLGTFPAWRDHQSRSTRRSRSRRLKQLEAAGTVSFVFERAGSSAAERIARLIAMKRDWAARRGVVSRTIWDRSFEATVKSLVSSDSRLDARFSMLLLDGKAIAIELGFVAGGVYVSYLGAYDPEYEAFSPGILQLERTLEACFAEGVESFDLQPPADAYKQSFANKQTRVSSFAIALTGIGRLQTIVAEADPVAIAKGAINRMPAGCRRLACSAAQFLRQRAEGRGTRKVGPATGGFLKRALLLLSAGGAVAAAMVD